MIKAYFDGACEPNQDYGRMAYGGVIYHHEEKIHEISYGHKRKDGIASNNIAEYCGVISIMKYLLFNEYRSEETYIFGDSKLVIEQLSGNWRANNGKYIDYYSRAINCLSQFVIHPIFEWIPKERNTEADKLSRKLL